MIFFFFYLAALCCTSTCPSIAIRTQKTSAGCLYQTRLLFCIIGENTRNNSAGLLFFTHFAEPNRHRKKKESNNGITIRSDDKDKSEFTYTHPCVTRINSVPHELFPIFVVSNLILSPLLFFLVMFARKRAGLFFGFLTVKEEDGDARAEQRNHAIYYTGREEDRRLYYIDPLYYRDVSLLRRRTGVCLLFFP